MESEPPKDSKWPAEGLHYTWGSTRVVCTPRFLQGQNELIFAWLPGVEPGTQFDSWQPGCKDLTLPSEVKMFAYSH